MSSTARGRVCTAAFILTAMLWMHPVANAANTVVNGDFETGDMTGWDVTATPFNPVPGRLARFWSVTDRNNSANLPTPGTRYFAAVQNNPFETNGQTVLSQDIELGADVGVLSFDYSYFSPVALGNGPQGPSFRVNIQSLEDPLRTWDLVAPGYPYPTSIDATHFAFELAQSGYQSHRIRLSFIATGEIYPRVDNVRISTRLPLSPPLSITSPVAGSILDSLFAPRGYVPADPADCLFPPPYGLVSLAISYEDPTLAPGLGARRHWNGSQWIDSYTIVNAPANGTTWSYSGNLPTGPSARYTIKASTTSPCYNEQTATVDFLLDNQAPTVEVDANSLLHSVEGTARDNASGSGIAKVDLVISRRKDGQFWNGSAWTTSRVALDTILSRSNTPVCPQCPSVTWTRDYGQPVNSYLDSGETYDITATAYDLLGHAASASLSIKPTQVYPSVKFTTPHNRDLVGSMPSVAGTAADTLGGTLLLTGVTITLRRGADGRYWNGSTWGTTAVSLPATLNGGQWSRATGWPSGVNLPSSDYALEATVSANQAQPASTSVSFIVDLNAPTLTISRPAAGATLSILDAISGSASDNAGGSGLDRVELALRRDSDGKYWTGTDWSGAATLLTVTLSSSSWSCASPLPTAQQLPAGGYTIDAIAHDRSGLSARQTHSVTVQYPPPTPTPVPTPTPSSDTTPPDWVDLYQYDLGMYDSNPWSFGTDVTHGGTQSLARLRIYANDTPPPGCFPSECDEYEVTPVAGVSVSILRLNDLRFWNGSAWVNRQSYVPASNEDEYYGLWTRLDSAVDNTPDGYYMIQAVAYDAAGNRRESQPGITFLDRVAPPAAPIFTSPADGAFVSSLTASGTCSDNAGGSGVAIFGVRVQRLSDGLYYNYSDVWSTTPVDRPISSNNGSTFATNSGIYTLNGVPLTDGQYVLTARSYDKANNASPYSAPLTLVVDTLAPDLSITTPLDGAVLRHLSTVAGTIVDGLEDVASGAQKVDLQLQRLSDGFYWNRNGSATGGNLWVNYIPTPLASAAIVGTAWEVSGASLPADSNFIDGNIYKLTAIGYDWAGNSTTRYASFRVDRTAPTVAVATPANGSAVQSLDSISGNAFDNPGGSGLSHVVLALRRSDGAYWSGANWSQTNAVLPTSLATSQWTCASVLPSGANLGDGVYSVTATAYDQLDNSASVVAQVRLDNTTPMSVAFDAPQNNAVGSSISSINGTAADNPGGSGINRVQVTLQRPSDGRYWTGSDWTNAAAALPTALGNNSTGADWSCTAALPAGSALPGGRYVLAATAFDRAGNSMSSSIAITIAQGAGPL